MDNLGRPSWDQWFMSMAFLVSTRSPDVSTKHGSVLVNDKKQILGVGYNGFPRGSDDEKIPQTRPLKYLYILHSEVNCLLNSQNLMLSDNYTMYVTGMPCPNCMNQMIQSGVKKIVYGNRVSKCVDKETEEIVKGIAADHGVEMVFFNESLIEL